MSYTSTSNGVQYYDMDGRLIPLECVGVTGPLKLEAPSEQDLSSSNSLCETLKELSRYETPEEVGQRKESLRQLQEICNEWVREMGREQNIPAHLLSRLEGKVFTFGSYRIGVNTRGADIDALLLVPRFIDRETFFRDFLKKIEATGCCEDIHPVPEAFVPVLKMRFYGVEIDLLFAKLDRQSIGSNIDLCKNTEEIFRNMDDRDVRSINGVRVTEEILHLVYNKETFKNSLRAIRLWARERGVYGNSLGFFGGVTWAILVAKVCQLYPIATPSIIVSQFFMIYCYWPWPRPVLLKNTEEYPHLDFAVWDPRKNINDQYHLLPVITPAFPAQNSTYNVSQSTKTVIIRELERGKDVVKRILMGELEWKALMEPVNFFVYRHYVIVIVTGIEKSVFLKLCGLVESRLRVLIMNFDHNERVELAHLFNRSFSGAGSQPRPEEDSILNSVSGGASSEGSVSSTNAPLIRKWIIGMVFKQPSSNTNAPLGQNKNGVAHSTINNTSLTSVDLSADINNFIGTVTRGVDDPTVRDFFAVKYAKRKDLVRYLPKEELAHFRRSQRDSRSKVISTSPPNSGSSALAAMDSQMALESTATDSPLSTDSSCPPPCDEIDPHLAHIADQHINRTDSASSISSNWAETLSRAQQEEPLFYPNNPTPVKLSNDSAQVHSSAVQPQQDFISKSAKIQRVDSSLVVENIQINASTTSKTISQTNFSSSPSSGKEATSMMVHS